MTDPIAKYLLSAVQAAPPNASTVLVIMIFWLLKQGMTAAARPGASRAHVHRMLMVTVISVACLVLAAVVVHLAGEWSAAR